MKNLLDLSGKVAIVTGGAGILGRGFCAALAAHGAKVALLDLSEPVARAAADEIREANPRAELLPVAADVSDPVSVRDSVAEVVARLGGVDVLHNNAATKGADLDQFFAPFEEYRLSTWREIMAVNVDGMFLMAQAVGSRMLEQGRGGSIVQTASIYGVVAPDSRIYEGSRYLERQINTPAAYSASKAAVIGLTRYLAAYWGARGIRVNALTPGGVESGQNETFRARYSERVPLGRMAERSEMEAALLFLASDASSYVTGQNLIVDGGFTSW